MAETFDAAIVLGGGLTDSGELLRPSRLRAERAVTYFGLGVAANILASGGLSVESADAIFTEASATKEFVVAHGVPETVVATEERSLETIGNACWTRDIAAQNDWADLLVVTSAYHVPRARTVFRHVYGKDFKIRVAGVADMCNATRLAKEAAGNVAVHYAFLGTKRGDADAVRDRLLYLHPRYIEKPLDGRDLLVRHAVDLAKHMVGATTKMAKAA